MRRPMILGAAGLVLALVAAGCVSFNVTKEVTGGGEPDGPFIVQIECEGNQNADEIPFSGSAADYPQTKQSIEFDLDEEGDASCLITEPEGANATTTTIECTDLPPEGVTCTDTPDGLLVEVDAEEDFEDEIPVNILVTNDIPTTTTTSPTTTTTVDPNALNVVVAAPNFTG